MDTKRKANGAAPVETDDRGSKRRKLATTSQEFDLSKGESPDSTTAYGLSFLEQIRRTADKSGRLVAGYFEKLIPRQGNADYYRRTRMPISLETIEKKLNNGEFENLAELESYFKRMISNAKEFYPRSSTTFDDAERIRKALSNYMTKTNPAYHDRTYTAVPTPLPPDDAEEEGEEEQEQEQEDEDTDAEGDEDAAEEEDIDDEDDDEEEEDEEPSSKRRSIIIKRRGSARATRNAVAQARESPKKAAPSARPDHEFEDVPYKGLTFQQAQEKLVEELLRHMEPEYDDPYFEPFINLPPRALKDYYKVINDPVSIRKLQKMVKGVHGRGDVKGSSDFKTWSAFEEKAKLLWTNAYFYNEEGSEIYALAQELEKFVKKELKKAQTAAPEPPQPKIKLKVGPTGESTPTAKKITIHVGGGRGGSVDSPVPQKSQSTEGPANGPVPNGSTPAGTPAQLQVEKARSVSVVAPSPSPIPTTLKAEESSVPSPAALPRPPSVSSGQATPGAVKPPVPTVPAQPVQHNPLANGYMEQKRFRGAGKGADDALISRVRVFPMPSSSQPHYTPLATVLPNPKEMQTSATINISPSQSRVFIVPHVSGHLRDRQYSLWTMVNKQPIKPTGHQIPGQLPYERCFEYIFHPGINVVETHLIAAVPRSERTPGGPEVELEVFTIFVNVLRN
ncbi:Fc.00g020370.m01.CDS01 [Cosmosporella sp. VM-42]